MLNEQIAASLQADFPENRLLFNAPMKDHTSFKIGGNADALVLVSNVFELKNVLEKCAEDDTPCYVMGFGTNLLVRDGGYRGVIAKMHQPFSLIEIEHTRIRAQAGASLALLARMAAQNGLDGLAFAAGIPGSVGGAVVMNAGAYGGEVKDVISRVLIYEHGKATWLSREDAGFSYRNSAIKNKGSIVLEAEFHLAHGNKEKIIEQIELMMHKRSQSQPLDYPSAGSTFKRPQSGYAAEMIEKSGLKGERIGGAAVSQKHCGFIVNLGNATANDVMRLMSVVDARVYNVFGIHLHKEIEIIGEDE